MAGPVAHIICAIALINSNLMTIDNRQSFIIGTSFPDIRYLGVIDRTQTHNHSLVLSDITQEKDAFKAGMLLHSLIDLVREEYMVRNNGYRFVANMPHQGTLLKFCEDIVLYDKIAGWDKICEYFDAVLPEESAYNIPESSLLQWHTLLQLYCQVKPSTDLLHLGKEFLSNKLPADFSIELIEKIIHTITTNPEFISLVHNLYDNIIERCIAWKNK